MQVFDEQNSHPIIKTDFALIKEHIFSTFFLEDLPPHIRYVYICNSAMIDYFCYSYPSKTGAPQLRDKLVFPSLFNVILVLGYSPIL